MLYISWLRPVEHKAGALEQTLMELASVVSDPTPKLILADELEAITEPGAGARIIAGMLLAAGAQKDTSMMLVTHLACNY